MQIMVDIFGWRFGFGAAATKLPQECEHTAMAEEFVGRDPHSTLSSQVERGPGAGEQARFGFGVR